MLNNKLQFSKAKGRPITGGPFLKTRLELRAC
jgi:hypothetical protein